MGAIAVDDNLRAMETPQLDVTDRGYLYGDGVFETVRVYCGVPFALDAHLERLTDALTRLAMPAPARSVLRRRVERTLAAAGLQDAVLRIVCSRQGAGFGMAPSPRTDAVRTVTMVLPLPRFPERFYTDGKRLHLVRVPAVEDAPEMVHGIKTTAALQRVWALHLARQSGCDDVVLVDRHDRVVEAGSANVFARVEGRWITPPLAVGALPGITRQTLLDLCRADGIPALEAELSVATLRQADEIALTSSIQEVVGATRVEGAAVGGGRIGPWTRALQERYSRHVRALLDHDAAQATR